MEELSKVFVIFLIFTLHSGSTEEAVLLPRYVAHGSGVRRDSGLLSRGSTGW